MAEALQFVERVPDMGQIHHVATLGEGDVVQLRLEVWRGDFHGNAARVADKPVPLGHADFSFREDDHVVLGRVGRKLEGQQDGERPQVFQKIGAHAPGQWAVQLGKEILLMPARVLELGEVVPGREAGGDFPAGKVGVGDSHRKHPKRAAAHGFVSSCPPSHQPGPSPNGAPSRASAVLALASSIA